MFQSIRVVLLLLLGGLCSLAQANGSFRDCPVDPAALGCCDDGVDPLDLIWDLNPADTSGAPGEQLSLLFAASLASDSGCVIEGAVQFYDRLGAPVGEPQQVRLNATTQFQELLSSYGVPGGGRTGLANVADGEFKGCTAEEAASFSVTETQTDAAGQPRVAMRRPVYISLINGAGYTDRSDDMATPERQLREVDLACRSAVAAGQDDGVDPLDLIWDISGGGTSQAAGGSDLLILVTPRLLRCERHAADGRVVDFLPKVKLEAVVEDSLGNRFTDTVEVDAESPSAVLSYPYRGSGERVQQSVQLRAKMPSCQTGRPYDMDVKLYQVGAGDETLTSRVLGGVRYKVPPPRFEYNGDSTVEP
jgi:hypothetical protein